MYIIIIIIIIIIFQSKFLTSQCWSAIFYNLEKYLYFFFIFFFTHKNAILLQWFGATKNQSKTKDLINVKRWTPNYIVLFHWIYFSHVFFDFHRIKLKKKWIAIKPKTQSTYTWFFNERRNSTDFVMKIIRKGTREGVKYTSARAHEGEANLHVYKNYDGIQVQVASVQKRNFLRFIVLGAIWLKLWYFWTIYDLWLMKSICYHFKSL